MTDSVSERHSVAPGTQPLLASAVRAGIKMSSFAPAASDLEELFLQITDTAAAERAAAARVAVGGTDTEVAA